MTAGEFAPSGLLAERRVLPSVTTGAGQHVQYVLMNPGDEAANGQLQVTGHDPVDYAIGPGGVFVHDAPPDGQPPLAGYGIVRASDGPAPTAHAIVTSLRRGGSARSVHTVCLAPGRDALLGSGGHVSRRAASRRHRYRDSAS